jgi:Tfp pilus assembly protein PilF
VSNANLQDSRPAKAPDKADQAVSYSARLRFGLASVLHLTGRVADRVVSAYDGLFALDDAETAKIYMGMGTDFARDGNSEDALATLHKTLQLQPDNGDAWLQVGLIQLDRQEPEAAAEAFQKAIALGSDCFKLHFRLAEAYADSGDHQAASKERPCKKSCVTYQNWVFCATLFLK